jgi:hypothetical protein
VPLTVTGGDTVMELTSAPCAEGPGPVATTASPS